MTGIKLSRYRENSGRLLLGFAIAALLPSLVFVLQSSSITLNDIVSILWLWLAAYIFAFEIALVIGIPLLIIVEKVSIAGYVTAAVGGGLAAVLAICALSGALLPSLRVLVPYTIAGMISGIIFWAIWTGRPTPETRGAQ